MEGVRDGEYINGAVCLDALTSASLSFYPSHLSIPPHTHTHIHMIYIHTHKIHCTLRCCVFSSTLIAKADQRRRAGTHPLSSMHEMDRRSTHSISTLLSLHTPILLILLSPPIPPPAELPPSNIPPLPSSPLPLLIRSRTFLFSIEIQIHRSQFSMGISGDSISTVK